MTRHTLCRASLVLLAPCLWGCYAPQVRTFPDRPVAWDEHYGDVGLAS